MFLKHFDLYNQCIFDVAELETVLFDHMIESLVESGRLTLSRLTRPHLNRRGLKERPVPVTVSIQTVISPCYQQ